MTQERSPHAELAPSVEIPKSLDIFDGNLEAGVSWSFNDAVIDVQKSMGSDFYLTQSSFAQIMPSNWDRKKAGQALADFDRAYERFVLDKMGYSQEEIDLLAAASEDEQTGGEAEEAPADADQVQYDRKFAELITRYNNEDVAEISEEESPDAAPHAQSVGGVALINTLAESETQTTEILPTDGEQERAANLDAFSSMVAEHSELGMLEDEFIADLENYLQQKYVQAVTV